MIESLKVVVPDDCPPVLAMSPAFEKLRKQVKVDYFDTLPGSPDRLIERCQGAAVVLNVRSSSKFSAGVMERCPDLKLISVWGTGTDNIDLAAAAQRGVKVTNTPAVSAYSVAEHCLALMLAVARRIPAQDSAVRAGTWPRGQGVEMCGKILGIVGLGAIGRRFAELGRAIGMRVIAWTMHPDASLGFELTGLDDLLQSSDVVSVHVRLSPETHGMLAAREFALMKKTAILLDALREKRIAGAGLDVFTTEPLPPDHPLTTMQNVVLTPHSAGITPEALEAGLQMAVSNVLRFARGELQ